MEDEIRKKAASATNRQPGDVPGAKLGARNGSGALLNLFAHHRRGARNGLVVGVQAAIN